MGRIPAALQPLRGRIQEAIAVTSPRDREEALVSALKVCGRARDFLEGKALHGQAIERSKSAPLSIFVVNALIDMYAKCGSMADARRAFETLVRPNVMSWNVLMLGYVANGESGVALDLFERMRARRSIVRPNPRSFMAASMACSILAAQEDALLVDGELVKAASLDTARAIHSQARSAGCCDDLFLATKLIDLFAKCGSMGDARAVFDEIPRRDAAAWNALMLGFVERGESAAALELFDQMDCAPSARSFVAAIRACASEAGREDAAIEGVKRRSLDRGSAIHDRAREIQCCGDLFVASALVEMYSRCGSVADARAAFEDADRRDVVLWTSLIQGYVENGESERAIASFEEMRASGCEPNARTLAAAIAAVASAAAREEAVEIDGRSCKSKSLEIGRAIHREAGGSASEEDLIVANALIEMYARCGSAGAAREIFDRLAGRRDAASWNAMIRGAASAEEALELFAAMGEECDPDERSFLAAIGACSSLAPPADRVERSREIHSLAAKMGLAQRSGIVGSALIGLLARCGRIDDAKAVFQELDRPDVVAWTSLIQGLVEIGDGSAALEAFARMGDDGCEPNARTLTAALAACAIAADRDAGRRILTAIYRRGALDEDPVLLATAMLDFHSKSGDAIAAERWFGAIAVRDAAAWNALIAGLDAERALAAYGAMRDEGARPTAATMASVIAACGHAGMIERGRREFEGMPASGIEWGIQHYGALIDMYGRANRLEEALAAVERLGAADAVVWRSLLGACVKWKNEGVARIAFQALTKIDERDPAAYVLMASVCRGAGLWEEHDTIQNSREGDQVGNSCLSK